MNTTTYNIGDIVEDDRGNTGEIVGIAGDGVEWQDIPTRSVAVDTGPRGYWIVPIKHLSPIDPAMINDEYEDNPGSFGYPITTPEP